MPTKYVTIKQSEPSFSDYLWGRTSETLPSHQRPLPIKTYHLGTPEESITFEIQNSADIKRPHFLNMISSLIKLKSFSVILFPLFFTMTKNNININHFDFFSLSVAVVASLFLFAGLNIRNDIFDHISGFDRVNIDAQLKPIRQGWITATQASRVSLLLILTAAFLSLTILFYQPKLRLLVLLALSLFSVGRFAKNNSYKQQHLGEFILMVLVGPILVSGYQLAVGADIDFEVLSFGLLWGYIVFYLIQVNNFSHLMTSSQAGIQNTMTKLGFDRSQKFLLIAWTFFILFFSFFQFFYQSAFRLVLCFVFLILASVPLYKKIINIKSPMGSGLQLVRQTAHRVFVMMMMIYVGSFFIEKSIQNMKFWFADGF